MKVKRESYLEQMTMEQADDGPLMSDDRKRSADLVGPRGVHLKARMDMTGEQVELTGMHVSALVQVTPYLYNTQYSYVPFM